MKMVLIEGNASTCWLTAALQVHSTLSVILFNATILCDLQGKFGLPQSR